MTWQTVTQIPSQSAAAGTFAKVCMHDSVCRCGGSGCKHYLLVQHWVNLRVHLPRNGNKRLWDESTSLWSVHTSIYSQSPKTSCVLSLVCKNFFYFFFLFFYCWGFIWGSIPCTVVYSLICCSFITEHLLVCSKITLQLKHEWRQKALLNLLSMLQVQDSKLTIVHLKLLLIPSIVKEEEEKKDSFNNYQKMH